MLETSSNQPNNRDFDLPDDDATTQRRRLILAGVAFGGSVLGTLALTAPFVFMRSPLPYMATPGHKVHKALMHLNQKHPEKRGGTFVDLGSGDGEAVFQALQAGYQKVVGIELNYTLYAIAQLRRKFFWTPDQRLRSSFLCRDFFKYNLKEADTVMIFGVNPLMKALSEKIKVECQPGTHNLSYRFLLPTVPDTCNHTLQEQEKRGRETDALLRASIVYDEQEMRVYRCRPNDDEKKSAARNVLVVSK